MASSRVVDPDAIRLTLSDGEWIDVKRELNTGEARRVFTNVVKTMHAGEKAELDPEKVGITQLCEYIVAWSLIDREGKALPCDPRSKEHPLTLASLNSIDQDTYIEITESVDAHQAAAEKARAERKNGRGTSPASIAT